MGFKGYVVYDSKEKYNFWCRIFWNFGVIEVVLECFYVIRKLNKIRL